MNFAQSSAMLKNPFILLFLSVFFKAAAQSPIGGTINDYDLLQSIGPGNCGDSAVVQGQMNYSVGDLILFYNPVGASYDLTSSNSFGDSLSIGNSGRYEFAYVAQANSPLIILDRSLSSIFGSGTMIIKVPELGFVEATSDLSAPDYSNGTGGVFVLRAERLKLSSDILMSEKGFRGGFSSRNMGVACGTMGYSFPALNNGGAPKGGGIGNMPNNHANGRGHFLNGGGGGNNHNAGGGGGASAGAGGKGGDEWSGCSPSAANGGVGGQSLIQSTKHLYMGGGGGSGHNNVNNLSSEGGHGGGLVMLFVDTLEANGGEIFVEGGAGKSMINSGAEGAGGGGAGGTVFLSFKMVVGAIRSHLHGGDGGDIPSGVAGPGGGGGGGFLYASLSSVANYSAGLVQAFFNGGDHGQINNGNAYGSVDGNDGLLSQTINPIYPSPFNISGTGPGSAFLGRDTTICPLDSILLEAPANADSYLWSTGDTTQSIYSSGPGLYWVQYFVRGCIGSVR